LGEAGLTRLAELNHAKALDLADRLQALEGVEVLNDTFFNEFTVRLPRSAADAVEAMAGHGVLGGVPVSRLYPGAPEMEPLLLVAATESNGDGDMDALTAALRGALR
jgi:glycine dehydrogenase subunit 1